MNYVEINEFEPGSLDQLLKNVYDKYNSVVFIIYFSKFPVSKINALMPIIEKYKLVTIKKLKKTIVHIDNESDYHIAKYIRQFIKSEKPIEYILNHNL